MSGMLERIISEDQQLEGSGRWLRGTVNSSLVVDTEKQIFFFNRADIAGDAYVYLTKVRGFSHTDAREYLARFTDYQGTYVYNINTATGDVVVFPKLVDAFFEAGRDNRSYWYKRGFTDDVINRYQLGFYNEMYMIPIFLDGTFMNFQMRRDDPKTIRSYYRGLGPLPFNFDILKLTSKIVIAEGPTDCIRLNQEGIPCVSQTGGSENWKTEWYGYFVRQKEIYVVYDNDEAGRIGARKLAKILGEYRTKIYCFDDKDKDDQKGYDMIDYFLEGKKGTDFMELIENNSKHTFELEGDKIDGRTKAKRAYGRPH